MSGESKNHIDFIQPRTGELLKLTEEDIADASEILCELVDDIQLAHANIAVPKGYSGMPKYTQLNLEQRRSDGGWYDFTIISEEAEVDSTALVRTISVREFDFIGDFMGRHQYTCRPGVNEVVRSDTLPASSGMRRLDAEQRAKDRESSSPLSLEQQVLLGHAMMKELLDAEQFERQMGFNHLPVGEEEIGALSTLLRNAEPAQFYPS